MEDIDKTKDRQRRAETQKALTHTQREKGRESKRENQKVMDSNSINATGKTSVL